MIFEFKYKSCMKDLIGILLFFPYSSNSQGKIPKKNYLSTQDWVLPSEEVSLGVVTPRERMFPQEPQGKPVTWHLYPMWKGSSPTVTSSQGKFSSVSMLFLFIYICISLFLFHTHMYFYLFIIVFLLISSYKKVNNLNQNCFFNCNYTQD